MASRICVFAKFQIYVLSGSSLKMGRNVWNKELGVGVGEENYISLWARTALVKVTRLCYFCQTGGYVRKYCGWFTWKCQVELLNFGDSYVGHQMGEGKIEVGVYHVKREAWTLKCLVGCHHCWQPHNINKWPGTK